MPKNTIDERVAELIFRDKEMARHVDHFTHKKTNHKTGLDFKQALYQDLLELIGTDDTETRGNNQSSMNPNYWTRRTKNRNELREEQRAKLKQYFGEEND